LKVSLLTFLFSFFSFYRSAVKEIVVIAEKSIYASATLFVSATEYKKTESSSASEEERRYLSLST